LDQDELAHEIPWWKVIIY